jgi:hypothetical protein
VPFERTFNDIVSMSPAGYLRAEKYAVTPPGPGEQQESMVFIDNLSGYGGEESRKKSKYTTEVD